MQKNSRKAIQTIVAFGALTGAMATPALAQPRISAQSIIVNPVQPELSAKVWLDRQAGSNQTVASYTEGEKVTINATVNRDAYVYLFNVDPSGSIDMILPNGYAAGNAFMKAGTTRSFPPAGSSYTFTASAPYGLSKVLMIASLEPLDMSSIARIAPNSIATVNVSGQERLAQALSIVVNPIPERSWVTDTVTYNTVARIQTGSLLINSNVDGARVIVDGRLLGNSGTTFSGLTTGVHQVRVEANGYTTWSGNVTINRDATTSVNVNFAAPTPAPAPVTPVTRPTTVLDLFQALLGGVLQTQVQDPLRAAYDQRLNELQKAGFQLASQRQGTGYLEATLQSRGTTLVMRATNTGNRNIEIREQRTTRYTY